jgi:hypothetical protein
MEKCSEASDKWGQINISAAGWVPFLQMEMLI